MQDLESQNEDKGTRSWATILHLSVLFGYVVWVAGLIVPVVIFFLKKDQLPGLVPHAHVIFNWLISVLIYAVISVLLMFVGIGFLLIGILAILSLLFPIIGAVKASEGQVWPYPLSIQFFK